MNRLICELRKLEELEVMSLWVYEFMSFCFAALFWLMCCLPDWIFFYLTFYPLTLSEELKNLRSATSIFRFSMCWTGAKESWISLFPFFDETNFYLPFWTFGLRSALFIPVRYQRLLTWSIFGPPVPRFIYFGLDTSYSLPLIILDFGAKATRLFFFFFLCRVLFSLFIFLCGRS